MQESNYDITDAITKLEKTIEDAHNQISFIKSIDFTKPVTENQWHLICETPLRNSELLAVLVKNTFPLAENILVHCNYVYFDMMGFRVQIPTSRGRGINVDTSWYHKDFGEPTRIYRESVERMTKYFNAVDNKAGWYECAKYLLGTHYRKWFLFVLWWSKYKWKDPNREQYEKIKNRQEQDYKERVEKYHSERQKMKNKTEKLVNELLPILDEFSKDHYMFNNDYGCSIARIREYENI